MNLYVDASPTKWAFVLEAEPEGDELPKVVLMGVNDFEREYTSNEGEYEAVVRALRQLANSEDKPKVLNVFSDSKLVVNQVNSEWHVKKASLVRKVEAVWDVANQFKTIRFRWVPRRKNRAGKLLK